MKRLAWRSLSGCLLAALTACTGQTASTATSGPPPATPAPATAALSVVAVVASYYRDVVVRNYPRAFGYVAAGATGPDGGKLTLGSFLQLAYMLDGMGGPVTRYSIGLAPSGVVMTLYRARYGPYHAHLRMVRTGHGWAIIALDRI